MARGTTLHRPQTASEDRGHPRLGPSRVHRKAVLGVLCVTLLVISLDNTVLNVALPSIVRDIRASSSQLQWAVDAYALAFAGLLLTLGALGDRFGRKRIFVAGLAVFGGGSAFAAFAGSPDRLVLARAVMGVGAAALMPGTLSILTNVFTGERERARAIGVWSGTAGIGVAVGPIIGGVLLTHFWWGSVFLVNVPIAAAGIVASVFVVPESRDPARRPLDPVGAGLSLLGLVLVVWGVIEAPIRGWASAMVLGALVGGVGVLAGFVVWERSRSHPMLPVHFFAKRTFSAPIGIVCLALFGLMGTFFVITQFLQFFLEYTPIATGVRVAPLAVTVLVIAPLAVLAARRFGMKIVVGAGLATVAVGLGLLSTSTVHTTYGQCVLPFVLMGTGVAMTMSPCTASVMGSLRPEEAGVGSATNETAMQVGGALGVGVLGTALLFRYRDLLDPPLVRHHVPGTVRQIIEGSLGGAVAVAHHAPKPLGHELTVVARHAFISGMDLALLIAAVVVGLGALVALVALPNWAIGRSGHSS